MGSIGRLVRISLVVSIAVGCCLFLGSRAWTHCDTTSGPLIPEAKAALEKADVNPVLKWVKRENEVEVRNAFAKAIAVRRQSPEARLVADQFFLETLVRLHRAGEGAPYTGIKDEPAEPIVAMADEALADGTADRLIAALREHMASGVREKFERARSAATTKDANVEAGREYVEAYVAYMHYVEGIHDAILSAGGHEHAGAGESDAPAVHD